VNRCALFTQMFSSLSLVRVGLQLAGGVLGDYSMSNDRVINELEAGVGIEPKLGVFQNPLLRYYRPATRGTLPHN